jgi:hypothetical protein
VRPPYQNLALLRVSHYTYTSSLILPKTEKQIYKERIACFPIKVTFPHVIYEVYEQ